MKGNGSTSRKLSSWIDAFIDATDNLESPVLFRRWSAISAIAATLEQKVWLTTSSNLYPNLYVFLIGHPGTGKTKTIRMARRYLQTVPEPLLAPKSLTFASLVDALQRSKRMLIRLPDPALEYNTMLIAADELGTFIHKYDKEMADGLSAFFDPDEYGHERRGGDIKIKIKSPQLNLLCGSTPSNLVDTLPDSAWGQGFTSRVIMVFSDERIVGDDFANVTSSLNSDLSDDLSHISTLVGQFEVTADYRNLVNLWREQGEKPYPTHPKLIHYNSRRRVSLYKLSMIAAVDKSDQLILTRDDFNRAMNWLVEAERYMEDIFKASQSSDSSGQALEEIYHYILTNEGDTGVPEHKITNFAKERIPIHSVLRTIEIMERTGQIKCCRNDKGTRYFKAEVSLDDDDPDLM